MDAVCRHDAGSLFRKLCSVQAAVVGDDDAFLLCPLALSRDHIGECLGGMADDVDVHMVQPQLHGAAQTRGAELKRRKEAALDLLLVIFNAVEFLPLLLAERGTVQPMHILILVRFWHGKSILSFVTFRSFKNRICGQISIS